MYEKKNDFSFTKNVDYQFAHEQNARLRVKNEPHTL